MNFKLKIWRQANAESKGKFATYEARNISPDTSFLEMLDIVNDELTERGEAPIAFDSDCRDGSGRVHRLRSLRRGLPECIGHAFHRRKSVASRIFTAGRTGTDFAGNENGAADGYRRFRQLHEHLRMRSRLSRGNQRRFHR